MNLRIAHVSAIVASAIALAGALTLFAPAASAQQIDGCSMLPGNNQPHFVWGVALDDADGGLVKHVGPGVQSPRSGVLHPTEGQVWLTGLCWTSPNGSLWFEIWNDSGAGASWVSGNFLQPAWPACALVGGLDDGYAVRVGDQVGFRRNSSPTSNYDYVSVHDIAFGSCPAYPSPVPYFGPVPVPLFHPQPPFTPPPMLRFPRRDGLPGIVVCG